nr:hypothetical protein [Chlamydiota bacterium]
MNITSGISERFCGQAYEIASDVVNFCSPYDLAGRIACGAGGIYLGIKLGEWEKINTLGKRLLMSSLLATSYWIFNQNCNAILNDFSCSILSHTALITTIVASVSSIYSYVKTSKGILQIFQSNNNTTNNQETSKLIRPWIVNDNLIEIIENENENQLEANVTNLVTKTVQRIFLPPLTENLTKEDLKTSEVILEENWKLNFVRPLLEKTFQTGTSVCLLAGSTELIWQIVLNDPFLVSNAGTVVKKTVQIPFASMSLDLDPVSSTIPHAVFSRLVLGSSDPHDSFNSFKNDKSLSNDERLLIFKDDYKIKEIKTTPEIKIVVTNLVEGSRLTNQAIHSNVWAVTLICTNG